MLKHAAPRWLRPALLAIAGLVLAGWFSTALYDSDSWWHLKTGQYIWEHRKLPVPDPFAYTTALSAPAYRGEEATRYFNLTHEWLAQLFFYLAWKAGGIPGVILLRALLLAGFCAAAGVLAWRRAGHFYRGLATALIAATVASGFAMDRPFLFTFLFLGFTVAILESRRGFWLLPPLFVVWANCHGGYFLGWVVLGAYCAEALIFRWRKEPAPGARTLWIASAGAVLASGLNPNGYSIFRILGFYRSSYLTSRLLEWQHTPVWPLSWPVILLTVSAIVLLWARKRVRPSDWLLFVAFGAAALMAQRNIILIALIAPVAIASYLPQRNRPLPEIAEFAAGLLLLAGLAYGTATDRFFQLRAQEWKYPAGAVEFLRSHGIQQRMFNSYEYGGYLIWKLWPEQRVFIDGRALSESLFMDYARILYNHDPTGGKSGDELLDSYGVGVIVMNGFEYASGNVYTLAPALADPRQTKWKLVYHDAEAIVLMRQPPPGVPTLPSLQILDHLEAECGLHIDREPQLPRCARSLAQTFAKVGDFRRARKWLGTYLSFPHPPDPEADEAYQKFVSGGY